MQQYYDLKHKADFPAHRNSIKNLYQKSETKCFKSF